MDENLGIPGQGYEYHKLKDDQSLIDEFYNTNAFFEYLVKEKILDIELKDFSIEFINYGDTELVYILDKNKKYTLLLGQPWLEKGVVKREYENLKFLAINNPNVVVEPKYYIENDNKEAYITPYIYQARCIASQDQGWGVYIPEPYYRFEPFNEREKEIVNTVMIANLVRLYDSKNNLGIVNCKLGGGDFILEKNWDYDKNLDNTLDCMKLIAARKLDKIPFKKYLKLLRTEMLKRTYYSNENQKNKEIIINDKSRVPMTKEEIDKGIQLGLRLRKKN